LTQQTRGLYIREERDEEMRRRGGEEMRR